MEQHSYDVVIVGGGAAGLSAALVLGRARRRVAVVDAGAPRNAPAAHMQGFLSRDGMPPADFLELGREEVTGYGVEIIDGTVTQIEPGFVVRLASGADVGGPPHPPDDRSERRPARHSRCSRALGTRSPALPLLPRLGGPRPAARRARHAPRRGAARPAHPAVVRRCRLLRPHRRPDRVGPGDARGTRRSAWSTVRSSRLVVEADRLTGVELADGTVVPRSAVFIRPRNVPHPDGLLAGLGVEVDADGFAVVDRDGRTSTPGVFGRRQRRRSSRVGDRRRGCRRHRRDGDQRRSRAGRRAARSVKRALGRPQRAVPARGARRAPAYARVHASPRRTGDGASSAPRSHGSGGRVLGRGGRDRHLDRNQPGTRHRSGLDGLPLVGTQPGDGPRLAGLRRRRAHDLPTRPSVRRGGGPLARAQRRVDGSSVQRRGVRGSGLPRLHAPATPRAVECARCRCHGRARSQPTAALGVADGPDRAGVHRHLPGPDPRARAPGRHTPVGTPD